MKVIITESQFNSKVRERLIDSLVDGTKILHIGKRKYDKYKYHGHVYFPFSDNSYDISFNNSEEYVFTMPPLYNMKNWFLMIGVDVDESFTEAEKLRTFYLDKLEVKFKKIINDYLND